MQTINRNNYEEYFLLYADNELNAEMKLAVENFIEQNTDLAVELDMLLKTKSAPEEMIFADKDLLLRTEGNSINETNYEEYFLLYIDNELSIAKREEVEMYVLQHPKLQKEFINLKQVVLTPETLNYNNKEDLYRTEKKRTVYMRPWRFAAAAIFIGICAVGWWLWQKPEHTVSVAIQHPTEIKPQQNIAAIPVDTTQQQIINKQAPVAQQTVASTQNKIVAEKLVTKKKGTPPVKTKENDVAKQPSSTQKENIIHNKPIDQNNIVKQNVAPVAENNDVAIENSSSKPLSVPDNEEETTSVQADENTENNKNNYKIYPVAYKEINTADDENSLHVGAFDLNKKKVKNLFKKAQRLFNKQDNLANDDGKLQVANFEIQTKQQ
jgi:hypothetical protein